MTEAIEKEEDEHLVRSGRDHPIMIDNDLLKEGEEVVDWTIGGEYLGMWPGLLVKLSSGRILFATDSVLDQLDESKDTPTLYEFMVSEDFSSVDEAEEKIRKNNYNVYVLEAVRSLRGVSDVELREESEKGFDLPDGYGLIKILTKWDCYGSIWICPSKTPRCLIRFRAPSFQVSNITKLDLKDNPSEEIETYVLIGRLAPGSGPLYDRIAKRMEDTYPLVFFDHKPRKEELERAIEWYKNGAKQDAFALSMIYDNKTKPSAHWSVDLSP